MYCQGTHTKSVSILKFLMALLKFARIFLFCFWWLSILRLVSSGDKRKVRDLLKNKIFIFHWQVPRRHRSSGAAEGACGSGFAAMICSYRTTEMSTVWHYCQHPVLTVGKAGGDILSTSLMLTCLPWISSMLLLHYWICGLSQYS